MKRKHIVLGALFAGSAAVLAFTGGTSADQIVEAAPHRHVAPQAASSSVPSSVVMIAALRARVERVGATGGDSGRALFGALSLAPPLPTAAPTGTDIPPLPPAPSAPDMPFTYLGKQAADGRWEVYLARGEETLIVRDQTIIDGTYRIETISPPTLTLVYLPTRLVQTLEIGSAD
ncbi:hypothetical protein [Paraburkholderia azotifigens]|uniref:Secretion system X translation initiation factor n=1 Tax=Paraburkholderia azotifigens TaxID=2057004 RepID=A0A5C6V5D3_9BURK|nr:hypothetical protein [Paraburkholderia azotifigens]TXC79058.1 hypothetical protein FRZ40_31980 [Paraburkholderia azotifigens]